MTQFNTRYQAYRREQLHKLSNMDPDDLVSELNLSTDEIMDNCWEEIETYIEEGYTNDEEDDEDGCEWS